MNINGLKLTLKAPDDDGNFTQVEAPVFATARRHPQLLANIKAIAAANVAEDVAGRRYALAAEALSTCKAEEVDACRDKMLAMADETADASATLLEAIHAFVVEGFLGAGYDQENAERYASLVEPDHIPALKARCLMGSGFMDFTKAP